MRTRAFRAESLPEFEPTEQGAISDLENRLAEALQAHSVAFTLLWTRGITILISSLAVRKLGAGDEEWRQVLTQQWMDDDGEFSQSLGFFNQGEEIEVLIVAMAIDADVPRAVGAVSIQPGPTVRQIIPPPTTPSETMPRGTSWIRKGKVTV
jgi:hypothetical protein